MWRVKTMTQVIEAPERAPVTIDPRILERREEVARQRSRHRLQVVGSVGAVVLVVGVVWGVLHSPVLAARHVTVIGAIHTGVAPVVAAAALDGQPLVDVNPGRVAARVEALPWVAHATVTRHWPDSLVVTVVERVPKAVVESPGHGAVVVDGSGHVLATAFIAPPGMVVLNAPVVAGRPGSVLGEGAAPGLAALAAVPSILERRVEQVDVAADGDVTMALTGHIGVTLGPAVDLPAKFEALLSVLVDVPPTVPEVVDVTVPDSPAVGPPAPPASPDAGAGGGAPHPSSTPGSENARARWVTQRRQGRS
jgi:cell division protein FtsQ